MIGKQRIFRDFRERNLTAKNTKGTKKIRKWKRRKAEARRRAEKVLARDGTQMNTE